MSNKPELRTVRMLMWLGQELYEFRKAAKPEERASEALDVLGCMWYLAGERPEMSAFLIEAFGRGKSDVNVVRDVYDTWASRLIADWDKAAAEVATWNRSQQARGRKPLFDDTIMLGIMVSNLGRELQRRYNTVPPSTYQKLDRIILGKIEKKLLAKSVETDEPELSDEEVLAMVKEHKAIHDCTRCPESGDCPIAREDLKALRGHDMGRSI